VGRDGAGGLPYGPVWEGLPYVRFEKEGGPMSSVVKKRRKKIRKHKYDKMRKKTRWQRMHKK
jgi:hypothetical protein